MNKDGLKRKVEDLENKVGGDLQIWETFIMGIDETLEEFEDRIKKEHTEGANIFKIVGYEDDTDE